MDSRDNAASQGLQQQEGYLAEGGAVDHLHGWLTDNRSTGECLSDSVVIWIASEIEKSSSRRVQGQRN